MDNSQERKHEWLLNIRNDASLAARETQSYRVTPLLRLTGAAQTAAAEPAGLAQPAQGDATAPINVPTHVLSRSSPPEGACSSGTPATRQDGTGTRLFCAAVCNR